MKIKLEDWWVEETSQMRDGSMKLTLSGYTMKGAFREVTLSIDHLDAAELASKLWENVEHRREQAESIVSALVTGGHE